MKAAAAFLAIALASPAAHAGLTRQEINSARFDQKVGSLLPTSVSLRDVNGKSHRLDALIGGKPALLVLADYTCATLCGVVVSRLASALAHISLKSGKDYTPVVIGFDPHDGPAAARAFRDAHVGDTAFARQAAFLSGDAHTTKLLSDAVGLVIAYDAERDQFAHPAGVILINASGRIARYPDPLALDPLDLRLSLTDAGQGKVGSLGDRVLLLCYGWDAATGVYTPIIERIILGLGFATMAVVGGGLAYLFRRERRLNVGGNDHA
jgi:protein SCO1/2